MGSLYVKGAKLWARYKNEGGRWCGAPTPYRPGQEADARRFLKKLEATVDATAAASTAAGGAADEPLTVARYASKWLKDRKALDLVSHRDDVSRLNRHILPRLGAFLLDDVGPRRIREFVLDLRTHLGRDGKPLAPRTVCHIYHLAATMFRTAVAEELIAATPCVLQRGTLPKKVDKDPEWRATAIYTREEVERLISDARIPEDRRVLYAIEALAGLRHSEAAGLRWRQYDTTAEPLHRLSLGKTKSKVPRQIPVHPTLARILAEWKLAGWERTYGRAPTSEDLVTPTRNATKRSAQVTPDQHHADLDTLGLRKRRGHDLRRTFVTLAQVDGARRDLLKDMSHGPRGDIVSMYTTFPWPALCAEVAKLKIELLEGTVLDGDFGSLATGLATGHTRGRNRWRFPVTPSGLEGAPDVTSMREDSPSPSENAPSRSVSRRLTQRDGRKVENLAGLAKCALRNLDFERAIEFLEEIQRTCIGGAAPPSAPTAPPPPTMPADNPSCSSA